MVQKREASAVVSSLLLHTVILLGLFMIQYAVVQNVEQIDIQTVFAEEDRKIEEFTRELEVETEISDNLSMSSGGIVTGSIGGDASIQEARQEVRESETLKDPDFRGAVDPPVPGFNLLGTEMAHGEVHGETGAAVEGYGAAMSRLTRELIRLMREQRLLVVWLFDESDSMKNDQKEIRDEFHKVYTELGIAQQEEKRVAKGKEFILTAIHSYGKGLNSHTRNPTADENVVKEAIDKIGIDESGEENMCAALSAVTEKYSSIANRARRRLVLIVVSDEAGDDGEAFELMLQKVKKSRAPCYVLGRESIFGYPYAQIRWKDPEFGLTHWLQIRRGPETAFPETLQYDGLHGRHDAQSAGFGPYEQVRLAKETGGIFFLLPSEEENLVTMQHHDERKYRFESLREYTPLLISRHSYAEQRDSSRFRKTIWDVIVKMNPHLDRELNIQEHWYAGDREKFRNEAERNFSRALRSMSLLNEAVAALESIKELREEEKSPRWRANYDLALAQTMAYRVRLFQFLLATDKHAKEFPKPRDKRSNRWNVARTPTMLPPDEAQIQQTGVNMDELNKQLQLAKDQFAFVVYEHPGTPWAYRAQYELRQGFGMTYRDVFRDPRYDQLTIKLPKQ